MKAQDILKAMNEIDDQYIEEAAGTEQVPRVVRGNMADSSTEADYGETAGRLGVKDNVKKIDKNLNFWRRKRVMIPAVAACFVGVFILGYATNHLTGEGRSASELSVNQSAELRSGASQSFDAKSSTESVASGDAYAKSEESASADAIDGTYEGITGGVTSEASVDSENVAESIDSGNSDGTIDTDKLVYTCNISIQTKDYQASKESIKEKIDSLGGVIENESEYDNNYNWYLEDNDGSGYLHWNLTIRIPTEKYEAFMESAGDAGKVISRSADVQNISKEYHSTQSRIQALETQLQNLQEMMSRAQSVSDMITIESRISEVSSELDDQKTWLASMDTDVAYSTIYLNLDEVADYSRVDEKNASFGERVLNAIANSWKYLLTGLETLVFGVIYVLPFVIVIALIVIIIVIIRKKHKE